MGMTAVVFKRRWRNFREGVVGKIFSNVAIELRKRGIVEFVDGDAMTRVAPQAYVEIETEMVDPSPERRRRGRPPGSRNRPKVTQ